MSTTSTITYLGGGNDEEFSFNVGARVIVIAGGGTDRVSARTNGISNLIVYGGALRDIIELGSGADVIYGDDPQGIGGLAGDINNGNFDRDWILGGGNNDIIYGQGGADIISGENGDDFIDGGVMGDTLQGGQGNDRVFGGDGDDNLFGGSANPASLGVFTIQVIKNGINDTDLQAPGIPQTRFASTGDVALTGTGIDALYGENGNDRLNGGDGPDLLNGGEGTDTADYSTSAAAVNVSLSRIVQSGGDAAGDRLYEIENIDGSAFSDTLVGNAGANVINGGGGNDKITGLGLRDVLTGGTGNDLFIYKAITDSRGRGIDTITDFDKAGNDRIDLSAFRGVLSWRGTQAFDDVNQVRVKQVGTAVIVEVNTTGSLAPDMSIRLEDTTLRSMTKSDFIL